MYSASRANGTANGSDSMIVIGCRKLSNCAASTMYMPMMDSRKAIWKLSIISSNILPMPVTPVV